MGLEEARDGLGRILQVAVHDDCDIARDVLQDRGEGGLVPEVAGQRDRDEAPVPAGGRLDDGPGAVGAAVVDQHHLMPASGQGVDDPPQTLEELREHRFFVEERDADGDTGGRPHERRLALMYTMFHSGTPRLVSA